MSDTDFNPVFSFGQLRRHQVASEWGDVVSIAFVILVDVTHQVFIYAVGVGSFVELFSTYDVDKARFRNSFGKGQCFWVRAKDPKVVVSWKVQRPGNDDVEPAG